MNQYIVYCDGASRNNPGKAGWGAVIIKNESLIKEIGARSENATNNQMELLAVTKSLITIKQTPAKIKIYSDSQYVINGINHWIKNWIKNSWKTSTGKPVENIEYWKNLHQTIKNNHSHSFIEWNHVPAHIGVEGNERADSILTLAKASKPFKSNLGLPGSAYPSF